MKHICIDGFQSPRSRLDSLSMVQECLEDLCGNFCLRPVMPAFLYPYYNGKVPEDCGITAFQFLEVGHVTLHTFSFREIYYADVLTQQTVAPHSISKNGALSFGEAIQGHFQAIFPCQEMNMIDLNRVAAGINAKERLPTLDLDFGPHLFIDIADYEGPAKMEDLFCELDDLPRKIGMNPITRPYVICGETSEGEPYLSGMQMIAESHIAVHVFPERRRAYLDIFSCRPFDITFVEKHLTRSFCGIYINHQMSTRGLGHDKLLEGTVMNRHRVPDWLKTIHHYNPSKYNDEQ